MQKDTEVRARTVVRRTSKTSAAANVEWYTNAARHAREIANAPGADQWTHDNMLGMARWYDHYADLYRLQLEDEARP